VCINILVLCLLPKIDNSPYTAKDRNGFLIINFLDFQMKGMFPEYQERQQEDFKKAWEEGIFVFDTNVLLNLYRYQKETREQFISVLSKLNNRIWIPYHVALEFQRNRLEVIGEQLATFEKVRKTIEDGQLDLLKKLEDLNLSKRHSSINVDPLTSDFKILVDNFLSQLEDLKKSHPQLSGSDPVKNKVEELFDSHVGIKPEDQKSIDAIYVEAESRFKLEIPPGYKDKDKIGVHIHNGIIYKRKYADYLIWKQILNHVKDMDDVKHLIFVTADEKEDWWRKVNGQTISGGRSELINEACNEGKLELFVMYKPESFLKYSKEFLDAEVSEQTIEDVQDIQLESLRKPLNPSLVDLVGKYSNPSLAELAVKYPNISQDILIKNQSQLESLKKSLNPSLADMVGKYSNPSLVDALRNYGKPTNQSLADMILRKSLFEDDNKDME
jgi:hypothetical protein